MITNNSVQVNDYWFLKVLPNLTASDWQDLCLFFYKNNWTASELSDYLGVDNSDVDKLIKSLERKGLIYNSGNKFLLQTNEALHKITIKQPKQAKIKIEFEDSGLALEQANEWKSFLKNIKMSDNVREVMFITYQATGLDMSDPFKNIINIGEWIGAASKALTIADGRVEVIQAAIDHLAKIKYTVASPKSLWKTILILKKDINSTIIDVGGNFN